MNANFEVAYDKCAPHLLRFQQIGFNGLHIFYLKGYLKALELSY